MVWPGVAASLAWPESSSSPQAAPTLAAHSFEQWLSITAFWAGASLSYQPLFRTHTKLEAYIRASVWNLTALSMPKEMVDSHGKVMASATPRSMASRDSGADTLTLVAPSSVMYCAVVALAGRIFMPLICDGSVMATLEWMVPTCTCPKQYFTSFISVAAYLRYHWSSASEPGPGLAIRKGSSLAAKIGKRPPW